MEELGEVKGRVCEGGRGLPRRVGTMVGTGGFGLPSVYANCVYGSVLLRTATVYFLPKCVNIEKQVLFRFFRRTLLILR